MAAATRSGLRGLKQNSALPLSACLASRSHLLVGLLSCVCTCSVCIYVRMHLCV